MVKMMTKYERETNSDIMQKVYIDEVCRGVDNAIAYEKAKESADCYVAYMREDNERNKESLFAILDTLNALPDLAEKSNAICEACDIASEMYGEERRNMMRNIIAESAGVQVCSIPII